MAASPTVTVLIPTFNRADFLGECLDSILGQTLPPSQVIVVNDGSTDGTAEVLARYGERIQVIQGDNRGKPAALNAGLRLATGRYLWIFDDDDVALPDALERFVAPLEVSAEYAFSYSPFFYTDTETHGHRIGRVTGQSAIPDVARRGFLIALLEANFLGGAALFARRSCYDEVGDFDDALLRSQDYDMAIRIARRFTGARVPGAPTFHYRQHPGQRGATRDRFDASRRYSKWLEYDQRIFRRLYRELPLEAYLPPGLTLADSRRHAHLQRLKIEASKLLVEEARAELALLAGLPPQGDYSADERRLVGALLATPYYKEGRVIDHQQFVADLRALAVGSPEVRRLRTRVVQSIRWRPSGGPPSRSLRELARAATTAIALYHGPGGGV